MAGGRPPKPDNVHALHSTRSKATREKGHVSPEPDHVDVLPPAPYTLGLDIAKAKWVSTGTKLMKLKVLTDTDMEALESYCISFELMCKAKDEIDQEGLTVTGAMGGAIKNPACNVLKDAQSELRAMGTLLGLNPSARTKINVGSKEKEKPKGLGALSKPRRS